jgi:hypothetical protein
LKNGEGAILEVFVYGKFLNYKNKIGYQAGAECKKKRLKIESKLRISLIFYDFFCFFSKGDN